MFAFIDPLNIFFSYIIEIFMFAHLYGIWDRIFNWIAYIKWKIPKSLAR